jgi:UTP--glucose-1-phosphate uridylyltransferase
MNEVRKTVIPAAGLGTRMLPAAKAVPKELLPVLDKPTIQYVVEEAAGAGVTHVLLVSSPAKQATEQHFRPNVELEKRLDSRGKAALLASIRALMAEVTVSSVDQPQQLGLGDAVRHARAFVGNESFLCQLGDAIFSGPAIRPPNSSSPPTARSAPPSSASSSCPRRRSSATASSAARKSAPAC